MKKMIGILLCILITISTIGCTSLNVSKDSYINELSHIRLTEEEQNIIDLVGVKSNISIYEYTIDDTYRSLSIWLETYKNGELLDTTPGVRTSMRVDPENKLKKGKIAVVVDTTSNYQWRISHQHANGSSSRNFTTENDFEANRNFSIGGLNEPVEIKPEVEILLDTFLFGGGNPLYTYYNQYYIENPEALKEYDYVYLLKCQFSKKAVGEVNNQK